jgi:hypothetical protein
MYLEGSHPGQVWWKYEGHALFKKVKYKTLQMKPCLFLTVDRHWCKAWVHVNRITYFLVLMFLANRCVDLKLHSPLSSRGDEEQRHILQFCNLLHTYLVLARTAGSKDSIAHLLQYHSRQRVCKTCLILLKIFWSQFVWSNLSFNSTPTKFSWNTTQRS